MFLPPWFWQDWGTFVEPWYTEYESLMPFGYFLF